MTFAGAVLVGGASRRMGRPKAFIEIAGQPMVGRVAAALVEAGADPVVAVGGPADQLEAVGLRHVPDRVPGAGPLGGIVTALRAVDAPAVAVLSCDLLAPDPAEIASLVAAVADHDVVVPVVDGRWQWIHAVWARSAVDALEEAFAGGVRAPRRAVDRLAVHGFVVDPARAASYADADTPADLPPGTGA